jgi:predicted nucleotidyltransferase
MIEYPSIAYLKKELRYNYTKSIRPKILKAFIIGSEAKGKVNPKSDLDIALIIPKIKGKTSIQFTEIFHSNFISEYQKPKWNNRIIDFQFYFEDDFELKKIPKIEIY